VHRPGSDRGERALGRDAPPAVPARPGGRLPQPRLVRRHATIRPRGQRRLAIRAGARAGPVHRQAAGPR
ncbi:MAG: Cysteine desulfurase, partial [uncultured Thermomicrobiales bacterium]